MADTFSELVAEAVSAPIDGWDFSWLQGRATEERPSWHYSEMVADRIATATSMLDLQCGGGEMLGSLSRFPPLMVATESWAPNVELAARRLISRGGHVVVADDSLPFPDESFDLITSRHPVQTSWDEVARVLQQDGTFLSQQVGPHTLRELTEFMRGPQPPISSRDPLLAEALATAADLRVEDLRIERLRTVFYDIGAVVYFLRLVVWIVPDFDIERDRDRLLALHEQIQSEGSFVAHAARFLIEVSKS
jgi:SAM-dependent methyltransferase